MKLVLSKKMIYFSCNILYPLKGETIREQHTMSKLIKIIRDIPNYSNIAKQILEFCLLSENKLNGITIEDLKKLLNRARATIYRGLLELEKEGIITYTTIRKTKYFQLNHVRLKELQKDYARKRAVYRAFTRKN